MTDFRNGVCLCEPHTPGRDEKTQNAHRHKQVKHSFHDHVVSLCLDEGLLLRKIANTRLYERTFGMKSIIRWFA